IGLPERVESAERAGDWFDFASAPLAINSANGLSPTSKTSAHEIREGFIDARILSFPSGYKKNKPRAQLPWFAAYLLRLYYVPTGFFPFLQPVRNEDASFSFFSMASTCRVFSVAVCRASSRSRSARANCSLKGSMAAVWACNSAKTPSNFTCHCSSRWRDL